MEDKLEIAVNTALSGSNDLKQEAIQFCNSIKDSPDGWKTGLSLLIQGSRRYLMIKKKHSKLLI